MQEATHRSANVDACALFSKILHPCAPVEFSLCVLSEDIPQCVRANTNNGCCFSERKRKIFSEDTFTCGACSSPLDLLSKKVWCTGFMFLNLLADIDEVPPAKLKLCRRLILQCRRNSLLTSIVDKCRITNFFWTMVNVLKLEFVFKETDNTKKICYPIKKHVLMEENYAPCITIFNFFV